MIPMTTEQKLDRILFLLEGADHQPGLIERVDVHENILRGNGSMGLETKVNIMWRIHALVAGGIGTVVGVLITYFIKH